MSIARTPCAATRRSLDRSRERYFREEEGLGVAAYWIKYITDELDMEMEFCGTNGRLIGKTYVTVICTRLPAFRFPSGNVVAGVKVPAPRFGQPRPETYVLMLEAVAVHEALAAVMQDAPWTMA